MLWFKGFRGSAEDVNRQQEVRMSDKLKNSSRYWQGLWYDEKLLSIISSEDSGIEHEQKYREIDSGAKNWPWRYSAKTFPKCLNDEDKSFSFRNLFYDRSIVSSRASPQQSATQCCFFKIAVSSLFFKSSSSCLRLLPRLPVTFILPSSSPSMTRGQE
jgi:hypothetical protein